MSRGKEDGFREERAGREESRNKEQRVEPHFKVTVFERWEQEDRIMAK